ncbi:MAG: hypothetical protein Q9174_005751 [Haloplaca sp. 1 TL-2023]
MATSVGDEINRATRTHHTALNQLILQLLPLCLPPHTSNCHVYGLGISQFLPIYETFEASFRSHIRRSEKPSRTESLLQDLHIPGLERATALAADISPLLPPSYRTPVADAYPTLQAFLKHMETSLAEKPHLLVAYTWMFYMALFSGGRYIRPKLRAGFKSPSDISLPQVQQDKRAGLRFWNFSGDSDGEDLKLEYKRRVAALSIELTDRETANIVDEGVYIMASLLDVVKEMAATIPDRALALEAVTPDAVEYEQRDRLKEQEASQHLVPTRPPWSSLSKWLFPMGVSNMVYAGIALVASKPTVTADALPATATIRVDAQ